MAGAGGCLTFEKDEWMLIRIMNTESVGQKHFLVVLMWNQKTLKKQSLSQGLEKPV